MANVRITKTAVDGALPADKDWLLWDDRLPGFGLKVTPKGAKVFVYQYRMGGRGAKVRRYTIGRYGKVTAEAARKKAEALALSVVNGTDPQSEKVKAARKAVDLAFKPYVERFRESCLEKEWAATHKYAHSLLKTHVVPVIGNTPLPDITRKDVNAALQPLLSKQATASNVFAVLRRLFSWAVEQEDIDRSPIEGMKPPPLPPSRDRVLSDEELGLVWRGAEKIAHPFGPMVQLLILTGARREEVAALDWSELNRETRTWSLPAGRSKNAVASENPLSDFTISILDQIARRCGVEGKWPRTGFVFSTTGVTSVSGYSRAKRRLDRQIAELAGEAQLDPPEPWRLHDLRRTLATGLQRLGVRLEVTEAVLNHVSGSRGGIVGIYQRHNWKDEKRAAVQAWADHVSRLLSDTDQTNVVSVSRGRTWSSENNIDDGYLLSRAILALRTLGSGRGEGWDVIREFWEELAEGHIDHLDAAYWAREIAERVVADVLRAEARERPRKALAAIGLLGAMGIHRKEREFVQMHEEFRTLTEELGGSFTQSRRKFAQQMLKAGYFEGQSVEQVMAIIDYIRSAYPPKK